MLEYPPPRPVEKWTGMNVQVALSQALPLRLKIMRILPGLSDSTPVGMAVDIANRLERYIRKLPEVLRFREKPYPWNAGPGRAVAQMMCELNLRRPLIC